MSGASLPLNSIGAWRLRLSDSVATVGAAPASAKFGLGAIALYFLAVLFAPWLAPHGEFEVVGQPYSPWSLAFPLGTDQLGRDVLSRLIFGARNTVTIAFMTTVMAAVAGCFLGLCLAAIGGWTDLLVGRVVDALMAIPSLIFALILLTVFGSSTLSMIFIIASLDTLYFLRLSRSVALNLAASDFVEAARGRGETTFWIARSEILPNIAGIIATEFGLRFCFVFLTISALSFLGLGIQPPAADWGSMVRENATLITYADFTPLIPAFAIALLTVAVNFVVDWIGDARKS